MPDPILVVFAPRAAVDSLRSGFFSRVAAEHGPGAIGAAGETTAAGKERL